MSLASCTVRKAQWNALLDVESYIEEHPDSALSILEAMSAEKIHGRKVEAKFSLLYSMALDKNYIDTADVSLVQPAVDYYKRQGTPEEKLKAYYYLGRIQYNAGDLNASAISYSLAERECPAVDNHRAKGLLYMSFADIYDKTFNIEKEECYVAKGNAEFDIADDTKHKLLSAGRLGLLAYGRHQWDRADSLFREGIDAAGKDTVAMSVFLTNYARMKVVQPEQDPHGAIELLTQKSIDYKYPLSIDDYGVYAYASSLVGDEETCSAIERQLLSLDESELENVYYWLYLIEKHNKNYKKALEYNIKAHTYDSNILEWLFSQSVTQALSDYYSEEAERTKKESQITKMTLAVVSLVFIILLYSVIRYFGLRRARKDNEIERLLLLSEETSELLQQANADLKVHRTYYESERHELLDKIEMAQMKLGRQSREFEHEKDSLQTQVDSYKRQLEEYSAKDAELKNTLQSLRNSYAVAYKEKFTDIGKLCNVYLESKTRTDRKDVIFRQVEKLIASINGNDKLHTRFERQINHDLNDIVLRLKAELGITDKKESRFICYCIAGFDNQMIAAVLGLSVANVYTKKSRLREKIRKLDSKYKEEYLRMI